MEKTTKKCLMAITLLGCLTVILNCFQNGINGNDFWWHIKVGEWICNHHKIPSVDVFSWYGIENKLEWVTHEWLSEIIFWLMYQWGGEVLVFLFSLLASIVMVALLLRCIIPHFYENVLVSVLFIFMFSVLTSLFFYGRPHLFSFFLLYAELECLYAFYKKRKDYMLCFIPFISILWSNMHGGSSILSYALCIVMLGCSIIEGNLGRISCHRLEKKRIVRLGMVTICSVLAIMVNPAGIKMLLYPYWNMSSKLMTTLINEWAAPDIKDIGSLILYFLPIFITLFGMLFSDKKIELIDLMYMLMFLFFFFRSTRFIVLYYIATSFFAFQYVLPCKIKEIKTKLEYIAIGMLFIALMVASGSCSMKMYQLMKTGTVISQALEKEMVNVVLEEAPNKLYNDYNFGETLIYNNIPVFFDARADVYITSPVFADGMSLMFLEQANVEAGIAHVDVDGLIEKYQFDAFLIMTSRPLYTYMLNHPEKYELLYQTPSAAYFVLIKN